MASACLKEELSCSICLNVYTEPVSLRCGHNYCRACIESVLDAQERSGVYSCPECRAEYLERPLLEKNRKLGNIVESFLYGQTQREETEVLCTYCVASPVLAAKTCLQCETSLCLDHLSIHNKSVDHGLIEPMSSLGKRKCDIHKKLLEYYCREDAVCVCVYCVAVGSHKGHRVRSLEEAMKTKQEKLRHILEKLSSNRAKAEKQVQSLQDHGRAVREEAAVLTGKVSDLFTDIRNKLEVLERRALSEVSRQMEKISMDVSDLVQQLEAQRDELTRRMCHIEELCKVTDPLTFLQQQESGTWDVKKETDQYSDPREVCCAEDLDKGLISATVHSGLSDILTDINRSEAADILLDKNTACHNVSVSGDLKSASWSEINLNYPENTTRFTSFCQVLSSTRFNSGQHYWEMGVSTSEYWWIGVAYPSIDRKGNQSKVGQNDKSWSLCLSNYGYSAIHNSAVHKLELESPMHRLGIHLDYEAGRLSFYQLCDPVRLLHTFTATFSEPLHALFVLWKEGWIRLRI